MAAPTMPGPTAPTLEALAGDLERLVQVGVAGFQEESLSNLFAILASRRVALREPELSITTLLKAGIARLDDDTAQTYLPILLDLDESGRSLQLREWEVCKSTRYQRNYVRQDLRRKWCRWLAEALRAIFGEDRDAIRPRFPVGDALRTRFGELCALAAAQLAELCRPDGSWAMAAEDADGEVTVTAHVASTFSKTLGDGWAKDVLRPTIEWVAKRRDKPSGSYGNIRTRPALPGTRGRQVLDTGPRETASAIKLVHELEGPRTHHVARGVLYLIDSQVPDRGWSESGNRDDDCDVLTTAYAVDALSKLYPELRHMARAVDDDDYTRIDQQFEFSLRWGVNWLQDHRRDGGWSLDGRDAPDPYITAHVLGFAWQVVVPNLGPSVDYLRDLTVDGGIPAKTSGPPQLAPTAMALLGLLRAADRDHENLMLEWARYVASSAAIEPQSSLDVYAATFLLLFGQPELEWLSGSDWREDARQAVEEKLASKWES